ncbi:MAG TPA: WXG100 family type VII secretion target [Streptosporangiaceae bacterium]
MAAGESAVDRAAMAQAIQQVDSAVGTIRGLQSAMNGYNSALQGGWTGRAATAFASTYEEFSTQFTSIINALQMMQEKLAATLQTYTATEEDAASHVNRIAGLLGN